MEQSTLQNAIEDFKNGKFVIVIDDEDRENEGDLVIAAEHATPEAVNFMLTHGRGLLCLPIEGKRLDDLGLPLMVENNSIDICAFTLSIDAIEGTSTGVSAYDRSMTIKTLINSQSCLEDFKKPGHMFPLRYKEGGVLVRRGHTEASVDLAKLAGLFPAAAICEILNEEGHAATADELEEFSNKYNIKIVSVQSLVDHLKEKSIIQKEI